MNCTPKHETTVIYSNEIHDDLEPVRNHRYTCCGWLGDWHDSHEGAYLQWVKHSATKLVGGGPPLSVGQQSSPGERP